MAAANLYSAKKKIAFALHDLLQEKNLSSISVTELMDKAGLKRQTFYQYFLDLDDAVVWLYSQKESRIADTFFAYKDHTRTVTLLLENMYEDRDFYKNVISGMRNSRAFEDAYFTILFDRYIQWIGRVNLDQRREFLLKLYCRGFTTMVFEWLDAKSKTSAGKMAEYLFDAMPQDLHQFF